MAENTKIEWATHTFNPWEGCQKVGPGCDHCYAETRNARFGGGTAPNWGPGAQRRRTSASNWRQPIRWNRDAGLTSDGGDGSPWRPRVFCSSLADVFDNAVDPAWREDLFELIRVTPNLDWLLLTKRIGNVVDMVLRDGAVAGNGSRYLPDNVWLGATIVNQAEADRDIPKLLATKAELGARRVFLSMEPLLGPVTIRQYLMAGRDPGKCAACGQGHGFTRCPNYGGVSPWRSAYQGGPKTCERFVRADFALDWVIVGGESGHGARPMHPDWARSLRDQCAAAGVPFLFKQWGEWALVGRLYDDAGDTDETVAAERVLMEAGRTLRDGTDWTDPSKVQLCDSGMFNWANEEAQPPADVIVIERRGKKAAGRLLDGIQHDGVPA